MGARSYIVRGKGNPESFMSCSHGAGRAMSRTEAKRRFSVEDHKRMTAGVECRKDADVIDETPAAYKPIEAVMATQSELGEIGHTLRQVVCVKGWPGKQDEKGGRPGRPASLLSPLGESGQSDGGRLAGRVLACLYNPGNLKKVPEKPKKVTKI